MSEPSLQDMYAAMLANPEAAQAAARQAAADRSSRETVAMLGQGGSHSAPADLDPSLLPSGPPEAGMGPTGVGQPRSLADELASPDLVTGPAFGSMPQRPVAPRPMARPMVRRGPVGPKLPGDLMGGFAVEDLSELEVRRLQGDITDAEYDAARKRFEAIENTPFGVQRGMARREAEFSALQGQNAIEGFQRESQQAEAEGELMGQAGDIAAHYAKEQAEKQQSFVRQMDRAEADYAGALDEVAKSQIDPNRYWKESGTGSRIWAALAAGLGGFSSGLTGGPNQAVGIITAAIDRDIDAQKATLDNKRASLAHQKTLIGIMRRHHGDEIQATAAARQAALSGVKGQLLEVRQSAQSADRRAAADQMLEAVQHQIDQSDDARKLAAAQAYQASLVPRGGGGRPAGLKGMSREMQARLVPGVGFVASAQEATKLNEGLSGMSAAIKHAKALQALGQSGSVWDSATREKALAIQRQLGLAVGRAAQAGAMGDEERKLYLEQIAANPVTFGSRIGDALGTSNSTAALDGLIASLETTQRAALSQARAVPGGMATVVDPISGLPMAVRTATPQRNPTSLTGGNVSTRGGGDTDAGAR